MSWEHRLSPITEDGLEVLTEAVAAIEGDESGLPKAEAEAVLSSDDRFSKGDVEYILEKLQSRGHIYYVNDRVRITPTE